MRIRLLPLFLSLALIGPASCRRERIEVPLHPVPVTPATPLPLAQGMMEGSGPASPHAVAPGDGADAVSTEGSGRPRGFAVQERTWFERAVPSHWIAEPPSSPMRLAQWQLPGEMGNEPAQCALFHFEGGGSVQDNVARWLDQFRQPDDVPTVERALQEEIVVGGVTAHLVALTGTYLGSGAMGDGSQVERPGWALFGAILQTEPPYFLKCLGPESTLSREERSIRRFLQALRPADMVE